MKIFKQYLILNNKPRVSRRHYSDIKSKLVRINLPRNNKMETLEQVQKQADKEDKIVNTAYYTFLAIAIIALIVAL